MVKEQFLNKWGYPINDYFKSDLNAVIASEIAKATDATKKNRFVMVTGYKNYIIDNPEHSEPTTEPTELQQPAPNPIREAYDAYKPIREKKWAKHFWIKKHSETKAIDERGRVWDGGWNFDNHPEKWELYTEAEAEQVTEQPAPPMTYKEAVNLIISNRLTHKWAGNDSWFACGYCGKTIQFCDENGNEMIEVKFDELDLTEWYPYTKPFDQDRFEAMFRAVVANNGHELNYEEAICNTENALQQLDAFYASKKGGNNG